MLNNTSKKRTICICAILIFVCLLGYAISMKNPFINASIFNAVYYKEGSYQEKIVIDGIVYFDSQKGVVNISELERKGLKITGKGDYSASVKLNNDIDVLICDDGEVYINKISNVQNHDIYVFGITNESDCYDMLKMYGLSVFDEKEHDIAIYAYVLRYANKSVHFKSNTPNSWCGRLWYLYNCWRFCWLLYNCKWNSSFNDPEIYYF